MNNVSYRERKRIRQAARLAIEYLDSLLAAHGVQSRTSTAGCCSPDNRMHVARWQRDIAAFQRLIKTVNRIEHPPQ